jgi:HEAT repeats
VKAALLLLGVLPLAAQPKLLVNAQTDTRPAAAGLEPAFRTLLAAQPQPAWIGYSVPSVRTYSMGCDYVRDGFNMPGVVHLEPPDHVVVLIRVEAGAVNRVRALSPDCEIDAGGVPVHWLTDVDPAQSIALLASLIPAHPESGDGLYFGSGALFAIAMHAGPAADQALEGYLAPDRPETLRLRAVSYFGSARGPHGLEVLKRVMANDPDLRVRERAVSAIANSREPGATDLLIATARGAADSRLRAQAVSGLGRRSGPKIVAALTAAAESDADRGVQRRALQALESMPDGEGVPVLIRIARTSGNPETRKQAMTALQRSRDPRVLAYFEDVLKQ